MDRIELIIECAKCNLTRKKPYLWLQEKHLPCPRCGNELVVTNSHIAIVEMKLREALKEMDNIYGTSTVTLRL